MKTMYRRSSGAMAALAVSVGLALAAPAVSAQDFSAAAIVNDTIITNYDVDQRARLAAAASPGRVDPGALRGQALDSLIADALKIDAAKRVGITVDAAALAAGLGQIAAQNGRSPEELASFFLSQGVSREALDHQVRAEVAWRELIRARYGSRAQVSEADLRSELAGRGQAVGESEYLLSEILVQDAATAQSLVAQLRGGAPFAQLARQYSAAPTASGGGDRGWVNAARMDAGLKAAVAALSVGQVTDPVQTAQGYVIAGLRDTRAGAGSGAQTTDLRNRLIEERLDRYARGLLQELQRDAVVERR